MNGPLESRVIAHPVCAPSPRSMAPTPPLLRLVSGDERDRRALPPRCAHGALRAEFALKRCPTRRVNVSGRWPELDWITWRTACAAKSSSTPGAEAACNPIDDWHRDAGLSRWDKHHSSTTPPIRPTGGFCCSPGARNRGHVGRARPPRCPKLGTGGGGGVPTGHRRAESLPEPCAPGASSASRYSRVRSQRASPTRGPGAPVVAGRRALVARKGTIVRCVPARRHRRLSCPTAGTLVLDPIRRSRRAVTNSRDRES